MLRVYTSCSYERNQRWEDKVSELYGNYNTYDRVAGYNDIDNMMQAIEWQGLLNCVEKFGVTAEIQQIVE